MTNYYESFTQRSRPKTILLKMARSCIDKIGSRRADLNNRFMDFIYQLWNPIICFIGDSFIHLLVIAYLWYISISTHVSWWVTKKVCPSGSTFKSISIRVNEWYCNGHVHNKVFGDQAPSWCHHIWGGEAKLWVLTLVVVVVVWWREWLKI